MSPGNPANLSAGLRSDAGFWHDNLPKLRRVLEEEGDAERSDQRCDPRRRAESPVRKALDRDTEQVENARRQVHGADLAQGLKDSRDQ